MYINICIYIYYCLCFRKWCWCWYIYIYITTDATTQLLKHKIKQMMLVGVIRTERFTWNCFVFGMVPMSPCISGEKLATTVLSMT